MGEIRATISITHYPQGVDHLIHSFKVMCNLMKVIYLYWINKQSHSVFLICKNLFLQHKYLHNKHIIWFRNSWMMAKDNARSGRSGRAVSNWNIDDTLAHVKLHFRACGGILINRSRSLCRAKSFYHFKCVRSTGVIEEEVVINWTGARKEFVFNSKESEEKDGESDLV